MNEHRLRSFYQSIWPVTTGYQLIRLGGCEDGGYLVPDCLTGIGLCLSPGTCGYIEFERQLGEVYGIKSLLCDPEEDVPGSLPEFMIFDRVALAGTTAAGSITLSDWTRKYKAEDAYPYLLTMDIEGAEVDVINSLHVDDLLKIRIATVEFHYLHLLHLQEENQYALGLCAAIEKMCHFFDVVHMRPNNHCAFDLPQLSDGRTLSAYTCIEITFLNKMMRKHPPRRLSIGDLPNPLDKPNNPDKPSVDYTFFALVNQTRREIVAR